MQMNNEFGADMVANVVANAESFGNIGFLSIKKTWMSSGIY